MDPHSQEWLEKYEQAERLEENEDWEAAAALYRELNLIESAQACEQLAEYENTDT